MSKHKNNLCMLLLVSMERFLADLTVTDRHQLHLMTRISFLISQYLQWFGLSFPDYRCGLFGGRSFCLIENSTPTLRH